MTTLLQTISFADGSILDWSTLKQELKKSLWLNCVLDPIGYAVWIKVEKRHYPS